MIKLPCRSDPVLLWIRDTYAATPLRVPEERVKPLTAILHSKSHMLSSARTRFAGDLSCLLEQPYDAPQIKDGSLATLAKRKTATISGAAGLSILFDLISGMVFDASTDLLKGNIAADAVRELRFSFPEAARKYVDLGVLGESMKNIRLKNNPYTKSIISGKSKLLVIDSALTSKSLKVEIGGLHAADLAASIRGIGAHVDLDEQERNTFKISTSKEVTFAFSSVEVEVDEFGVVQGLKSAVVRSLDFTFDEPVIPVVRNFLVPPATLLEWDIEAENETGIESDA